MTLNINDLPNVPGASRRVCWSGGSRSLFRPILRLNQPNPSARPARSVPTAQSTQLPDGTVRLSEVVSFLSYASTSPKDSPRATRSGPASSECGWAVVRLTDQERSALFYALLLKDLGCSSNAARLCSLFSADDLTLKRAHKLTDWMVLASAGYALVTWHHSAIWSHARGRCCNWALGTRASA